MSDKRAEILAWLDEQEALCAAATKGPWTHGMPDESGHEISGPGNEYDHVLWAGVCGACQKRNGRCTSGDDKDYDFICASRTVLPLALAAIRAAVELHEPWGDTNDDSGGISCQNCAHPELDSEWPCETISSIHAATVGS